MDRTIYDGKSLYDYFIDDDGSSPVLVIRDLNDEPGVPRRQAAYRTVTNDVGRIIAEIEYHTGRSFNKTAAIYRDTQGIYDGIDLIGTAHKIFNLCPGQHTTDEELAIAIVREIHSTRIALLNTIHSNLPMGRIEQFSRVEIIIDDGCYSYWIPGYPSKEWIMGDKSYRDIAKDHPQAESCVIEVVSHLIYREASPASKDLMQAMTAYDLNMISSVNNVFMGESARHLVELSR